VEIETDIDSVVRIHGTVVEFDVLDLSLFVHNEGRTPRPLVFVPAHGVLLQNPVSGQDLPVHVAQKRERHTDLLGKRGVGQWAVDADSENFRIVRL